MTTDLRCLLLIFEFLSSSGILFAECRTNLFDSKVPKPTTNIVRLNFENEQLPRRNENTVLNATAGTTNRVTSNSSQILNNNFVPSLKNDESNGSLANVEINRPIEEFGTISANGDDGEFTTSRSDYPPNSMKQLKRVYLSGDRVAENLTLSSSNDDTAHANDARSKDKKTYDAVDDKRRDKNKKPVASVEENTYMVAGKTIAGVAEEKRQLGTNSNGTAGSSLSRGRLKFQLGNAITESAVIKESGNGVDDSTVKTDVLSELPLIKYKENNVANTNLEFSSLQNPYARKNENNTRLPKTTNFQRAGVGDDGYTFESLHFDVDTERDYSRFEDKESKYLLNEPENSIDKIRNFNIENNANVKIRNIVKKPQGFTLTTTTPLVESENFRRTVSRFGGNTNQKRIVQETPNGIEIRVEMPTSTEVNSNSISKNEILRKPSVKPASNFNTRRRVSNANSVTTVFANTSNENSLPTTSTVWALASLKTPNQKIQKQQIAGAEVQKKDNVEITPSFVSQKISSSNTIKPFVSWSTKLQKTTVANQKDLLTATLKSSTETDSRSVPSAEYMENKIPVMNISVSELKHPMPVPLPIFDIIRQENYSNVDTNETKDLYSDFISSGRPISIDDVMKTSVNQNETDKNSVMNMEAVTDAVLVHTTNHSRISFSGFNYMNENNTKSINDISGNNFNEMNTVEEKRNENKNDKGNILTVVVATTTFESASPEISSSSTMVNEKIYNISIPENEPYVPFETTTTRTELLTKLMMNRNINDDVKYSSTESLTNSHDNNSGPANIELIPSTDTSKSMENIKSAVIVDSMNNANTSAQANENKFEISINSNQIENFADVNLRNRDKGTVNVTNGENEHQNESKNNVSTLHTSTGTFKNGSSEDNITSDVVTHEPPFVHEIYDDVDDSITPPVIHEMNETFSKNRLRDGFGTVADNSDIQHDLNPIIATPMIVPKSTEEIPVSSVNILPQPVSSTTSSSTVSRTETGIETFDKNLRSGVLTSSPSLSTSKTAEKNVEIETVTLEMDHHFTTFENNQNFPSIIDTTPKTTSPSLEPSTTATSTPEINIKTVDVHQPSKELPTAATFRPKLPPESVPGYLMLFFKSTLAEVCQTSSLLKENLFRFITQRSGRVQSKDQVIMVIDPEQCKEPDHSPRLIPVALYLVDDFGTYDKTLIDEIKTLLEDDNFNNYTLPIHEIIYHENIIPDNSRVIAAIIITSIAAVCLVLLIFLMCMIRNRQKLNKGQRCTPVSIDDYNLDNISEYNSIRRKGKVRASKRSYGNPTFDDPTAPSKTLNYHGLLKVCENRRSLDEEFLQIPVVSVKPEELPVGAEIKNRYSNVIPLPETRVSLSTNNNCIDSVTDYINANYVEGYMGADKFYIACQAPLQNTIEDFWKMVWKEQSKVIIMLTGLTENGVEKCADYLPPSEVLDCHRLFGDYQITLKKREVKEKYVISRLQLKNMVNNLWREITHLWYTSWPTQGVPSEQSSIIALLIEARAYMRNSRGPHIVHCSPGTGRTGTIIAIDICIRDYESSRSVNIPSTVAKLRRCRAGAVQTKEQYAFIYKVLSLYAKKLNGGTALDSM